MTPYITGTEPEITPEPEEEEEPASEDDEEEDDSGDVMDAEDNGKDAEKTTSKNAKDTENDDDRTIGKAIKNDVNVRSKPTKKGVRITRLRLNETATILDTVTDDDGETWYYIHTRGGDEGYVLGSLIEIQ